MTDLGIKKRDNMINTTCRKVFSSWLYTTNL